jgi:P-type Ca2+ transporter type 2C
MATTQSAPTTEQVPVGERPWYVLPSSDVARSLGVDPDRGLSAEEATARLERYGRNKFAEAKTEPRWHAFIRQYRDPMQIVLLIAGLGSIWPLHELGTGLVIVFLTLFNAVLGLRQEGKAAEAVAALQKMMIIKARVRRGGQLTQVPAEQLVPGDVVSIEAGDVVPADGRLLSAATLEIAESALTGESIPVSKSPDEITDEEAPLGDRSDMVYMNTNATRGAGDFVVTATGMATEVGHISHMLQAEGDTKTPLTKQLEKLTSQILFIAGAAVIVSIVLNSSRGESFKTVFTAAIAFAIAGIPTGLPAVVTTILSYGTQVLAKAGAIVKRLRSTETLGSTSAINSDKTGTLTLNQMTAVEMALWGRRYTISGSGYSADGQIKRVAGDSDVPLDEFLMPMVLASDAVVTANDEMIGDPTEGALVVLAEKGGVDAAATRERLPRVAELPFDAAYKLMATFHRTEDESGREVIRGFVKGAPDQLLARGTHALDPDLHVVAVDDAGRERFLAENRRLGEQGLRVLATARKDFPPESFDPRADLLPLVDDLTLLSLIGIVDPPRPTAKAAIETAKGAGIQVRMITGDHAVTAAAIAKQLGIEGRAITGAEFGDMSDDELLAAIDDIGVIARVTPEHKVRLIDTLKRNGHIVAMTGDGVNRPRAQEGRHRNRDGDHRHGGLERGGGDDPHRRQLRDDRQGRRARPRALRQPHEVHPLPDGSARRPDHHVPRRQHLQRRRWRPLPAAANPLAQLHDPGLSSDRPRLRQAERRAHGAQAASLRRAAAAACAPPLALCLRPGDGGGHDRRRLDRRRQSRGCRRADDGIDDVRPCESLLLVRMPRRAPLDLQPRHLRGPPVFDDERPVSGRHRPHDRAQSLAAVPRDRAPELQAVARLHRARSLGGRRLRGPEGDPAAARTGGGARGRPGGRAGSGPRGLT